MLTPQPPPEIVALDYHGKIMNPEPVNLSLFEIAARLVKQEPVIAKLEPGDGTHYCLLIVPCWANYVYEQLGRYGIRPNTANGYLIITQLNDTGGHAFYSFYQGTEEWDMKYIEDAWTRQVFSWWCARLWAEIKEARQ
jgi:hypothetical protein